MSELRYHPGDEHREDYTDVKRKLLIAANERSVAPFHGDGLYADFIERVMMGDVDDNEFDADIQTTDSMEELQLMFVCTDERAYVHPEVPRPGFFLKQPEITECFHQLLKPHERIALAQVAMGRARFETEEFAGLLSAGKFLDMLQERFDAIVRECTIGASQKRTRFDIL